MNRIVLASTNPVKLRATLAGFEQVFPAERFSVESVEVASGVRAQPLSDAETFQGARTRADGAARLRPEAEYWVGIEGGAAEVGGVWLGFSWICIRGRSGATGIGRTASYPLPPALARWLEAGETLGAASDRLFGRSDTGRSAGAVGLLTAGRIDRYALYLPAVVLALVSFLHPGLFRQ